MDIDSEMHHGWKNLRVYKIENPRLTRKRQRKYFSVYSFHDHLPLVRYHIEIKYRYAPLAYFLALNPGYGARTLLIVYQK